MIWARARHLPRPGDYVGVATPALRFHARALAARDLALQATRLLSAPLSCDLCAALSAPRSPRHALACPPPAPLAAPLGAQQLLTPPLLARPIPSQMASYELTYFDGRGLGEVSRLIFAATGTQFKDTRLPIAFNAPCLLYTSPSPRD
jgi:hypothetical protein